MFFSRLRVLRVLSLAILTVSARPLLRAGPSAADTPPVTSLSPVRDDDRFQFAYETSINLGINNPNNYIINPQILELRWQPFHTEQFFHTSWTFTRQWEIAGAAVPFLQGPEHHYFGLGVGTRLIYAKAGSRWSIFVDGKLLVGFIDSSGPPHGQGEDLTFSPIVNGGVLYQMSAHQRVGLSLLYEHFSNAGLSEPAVHNEGLNTVGPMLEWNVSF